MDVFLKKRSHFFSFHFIYYQTSIILTMDSDRNKTINHRAQNMLDASPPPDMLAAVKATADSQSQQQQFVPQQPHQQQHALAASLRNHQQQHNTNTVDEQWWEKQQEQQAQCQLYQAEDHPTRINQDQPAAKPPPPSHSLEPPTPVMNNGQYQFVPLLLHCLFPLRMFFDGRRSVGISTRCLLFTGTRFWRASCCV